MTDNEQQPSSRAREFAGGAGGGGEGVHAASTMATTQASPDFQPASILMAANTYSGIGNATSQSTLRVANPYGLAMQQTLKENSSGKPTQ